MATHHSDDITPNGDPLAASGSTTVLEVLESLRNAGYPAQLTARPGARVRCSNCDAAPPAADLQPDGYRRVEGASDAADMNLVVWGRCPACSTGATLLLGYGPNATAADQSVLSGVELSTLSASDDPGATPVEATYSNR